MRRPRLPTLPVLFGPGRNGRANGRLGLVVLCFRSRITRRPFIGGPVRHPPHYERRGSAVKRWALGGYAPRASPRSAWVLTQASFGDTRSSRARLPPKPSRSSGPSGPPLLNVGPGGSRQPRCCRCGRAVDLCGARGVLSRRVPGTRHALAHSEFTGRRSTSRLRRFSCLLFAGEGDGAGMAGCSDRRGSRNRPR